MKRVFLLLLLASAVTLPARAELGIALAPMRIEIQISAGGQYSESFRLSNESAEPVRVRGELLDWYLDDSMTPQFADRYEQEKDFSCRDWLQINPREMDLVANGTFRVRYTLRVPAETPEGEYHCGAGFVTMPPIHPSQPAMGMFIAVRAVAAFYVVVGNPSSEPSFKDLSLRTASDGAWEAVAWFENQGLRHYRIQGFVEVLDERGQIVERVEYPSVPVLPKRVQTLPLRLKASLPPGAYQVRSQADVGLPEILEATTRVVVEGSSRNKR
jgi:hypothetical protein